MAEGDPKVEIDVNSDAFKKALAGAVADFDKQREAKGKWLRAWIIANPLPAARVIGTVCAILFAGIGWIARALLAG